MRELPHIALKDLNLQRLLPRTQLPVNHPKIPVHCKFLQIAFTNVFIIENSTVPQPLPNNDINFNINICRQWFLEELTGSPTNIVLLLIILFLIYKLLKPETGNNPIAYQMRWIPILAKWTPLFFTGQALFRYSHRFHSYL